MGERAEFSLIREKKSALLKERGYSLWPARTGRTHRLREFHEHFERLAKEQTIVTLAGRIRTLREHGGSTFLHLDDGSGQPLASHKATQGTQAYLKKDGVGDSAYKLFLDAIDIGDFIEVTGTAFKTQRGEETLEVAEWRLLAKATRPLPEKWHGLQDQEERFRRRYLDILTNASTRERFVKRAAFIKNVREFLDREGFLDVETAMLEHVPSGAEAEPYKTHMGALGLDVFLRISLELPLKKLIVAGYEAVYEIGRCFRNEGMDQQHLPEGFTMLEFYVAYRDYRWLMDFTERMYAEVMERTLGTLKTNCLSSSLRSSSARSTRPSLGSGLENPEDFPAISEIKQLPELDFTPPWPRVEYKKIFHEKTGIDLGETLTREALKDAIRERGLDVDCKTAQTHSELMDKVYKRYVRREIIQPTFLINHPAVTNPLAKRSDEDPSVVERFQVIAAGAEIANAYSELNDPTEQRRRFEEAGTPIDEDFITALEYGMPPTAGFGGGIDRLFMIMAGIENIRETILFPLMRPK